MTINLPGHCVRWNQEYEYPLPVFQVVWAQCSILKSSTPVKCHFGCQKSVCVCVFHFLFILGHFTKMCSANFPPVTVKASPKTACHKIQWLQFANRNVVGLRSWHSSGHFQIPITPAISTRHTNCNFNLTSTTICENGFSKHNRVKSDHKSRLKL